MKRMIWLFYAMMGFGHWAPAAAQDFLHFDNPGEEVSMGTPFFGGPYNATFALRNYAGTNFDRPVFDAAGNRLFGSNFVAMLYGGLEADSLVPAVRWGTSEVAPPVPFTYTPNGQSGYFLYSDPGTGVSYVAMPTFEAGAFGWLQVRAWDLRVAPTYEEAVALGTGYGHSALFRGVGGTGPIPNPVPPSLLFGLESFSLVPEPSTGLLLVVGVFLGRLVWRSRRQ
jgi:hypothetical protein